MHRLKYSTLICLMAIGCGGGDPGATATAEETAAVEAVAVAGAALQALSSASQLVVESAAAQEGIADETPRLAATSQGPCVTFTLGNNLSLTVDHGTGCQIGSAFISGAYVLRLLVQQQLGLGIEFRQLTINTLGFDGSVSAGVGSGRINATMNLDVATNGAIHMLDFQGRLEGQPSALLMNGRGAYAMGAGRWAFDATNIRQRFGDCYPDDGTLVLTGPNNPPVTVTFTANTPQSGLVEVRVGPIPLPPIPLPAYGACPPRP